MENTGSEKKIFREKTMEQLSAPEQLTGYLHVTGPGVWIVLVGLIILLAGLGVWGTFGRLVSKVTVPAQVENGTLYCFVLQDDLRMFDKNAGKTAAGTGADNAGADNTGADNAGADNAGAGNAGTDNAGTGNTEAGKTDAAKKEPDKIKIIIGDINMEADPRDAMTGTLDSSSDPELYSTGYLSAGKNVVVLTCDTTLKDGFYSAEVVTDELKPISLLFADK